MHRRDRFCPGQISTALYQIVPLDSYFLRIASQAIAYLLGKAVKEKQRKWWRRSITSLSTFFVEIGNSTQDNPRQHFVVERSAKRIGRSLRRKIKKAAILVMLQPLALAREPTAWIRAPSQPLMRSLLSQFQTPTTPRRVSRFFRVWLLIRSPCRADHSAYFESARVISPILSAVDSRQTKQLLDGCQRNFRRISEISVLLRSKIFSVCREFS
jgi:hypothetical protein